MVLEFYNKDMVNIPYVPQKYDRFYNDTITNTLSYLNYKFGLDIELKVIQRNYFTTIFKNLTKDIVSRIKQLTIAAATIYCVYTNNMNDVLTLAFEIYNVERTFRRNKYLLNYLVKNKQQLEKINIRKSQPINKNMAIALFVKNALGIKNDVNTIELFLKHEFQGLKHPPGNIYLFKSRIINTNMYDIIKICYFIMGDGIRDC